MFIALEGIDGSVKTTQAARLAAALGDDTMLVREPGGTAAGEGARTLLKDSGIRLDSMAELLLFLAARAQLVTEVIRPAMDEGRDVVCDRFGDSSVAYQGTARGLGAERVEELCDLATGGLWPDLTVLLRLDAAAGGGPGEPRGVAGRAPLTPEFVFSEGKVSGKLALQVMVGPTAAERAP